MRSLEISILKTLTYFNVFSYPLTINEILFFLDCPAAENEVADAVEHLVEAGQAWRFGEFYSVRNDASIAERRIRGNELAVKYIKRARTVAKFLFWFPFVRGIAISGSLSKNFAEADSDLDFFVITKVNRLWIVRMILAVLFKIAFISGMKKWFCINYMIDESGILIEEQNIFTAVEISTLMPLKGKNVFAEFFAANSWVTEYLPNHTPNYIYIKDANHVLIKQMFEWGINAAHGNALDEKLLHIFKRRFERLLEKNIVIEKGFVVGSYNASKHAFKPLPQYFQPKILLKFKEHYAIVKDKYQHSINKESVL